MASRRGPLLFLALLAIFSIGFVYNTYLRCSTLQGTQRQVLPSTGVVLFGDSPTPVSVNHSKWSDSPVKHPNKSDVSDSTVENETQCLLSRAFGKGLTITALASPPGSGNTWVRNLLEVSTGGCKKMIYEKLCDDNYPVIHDISSWRLPYHGWHWVDRLYLLDCHLKPLKYEGF